MAGAQSLSEEELLYFKGLRILHKAIAPELRQLFKTLWEQHKGNRWQDDPTSGELFFKDYTPKSKSKRYDDMIKTGNVEEWDMTVLCRAFIEYPLMKAIDSKYCDGVSILRMLRNKYAHNISLQRHRGDYENDKRQVKKVFKDLGLNEESLTRAETIKLDDREREELRKEMETLRQELEERIQEVLNTLSEADQKILSELQDLKEVKEELLNKLTSFGRELVDELRTLMKEHLTNLTESDQEAAGGEGNPDQEDFPDWFQEIPVRHQQLIIPEKLIGRIAQHVGAGWELIAAEMDISKPKQEAIIEKHPRSLHLQVVAAFTMWKQKNSRQATITSLIRILWTCNDRCSMDWGQIEAVVKAWD